MRDHFLNINLNITCHINYYFTKYV
uniref:Uncharacterized protein n=1 Tax=Anguilla anguilla TaxID=7936 RepID=A0A0E9TNX2_ANGAN